MATSCLSSNFLKLTFSEQQNENAAMKQEKGSDSTLFKLFSNAVINVENAVILFCRCGAFVSLSPS
jgi:hypothetical protein